MRRDIIKKFDAEPYKTSPIYLYVIGANINTIEKQMKEVE